MKSDHNKLLNGSQGNGSIERIEEGEMMERGVQNPDIIDLIRPDPFSGDVVLHIIEERPWDSVPEQLSQFDEKLNRYLTYILNGFVGRHYPQYDGLPVRISIDCVDEPVGVRTIRFLEGVGMVCEQNGIGFEVRVRDNGTEK